MDFALVTLVALAMVLGVLGTVLPFVPGLPIVWAAALVYGVVAGFGPVGWIAFALITALFAAGMVAGLLLPQRRLAAVGAPRSTTLAGIALGIVGFFAIPIVGLPLGAAAGVWLAERVRLGGSAAAWRSTKQVVLGFGAGALVQVAAGLLMIFCWAIWVLAA